MRKKSIRILNLIYRLHLMLIFQVFLIKYVFWTDVINASLKLYNFHFPLFLFRGFLKEFRTSASGAGKYGIHQTINSQLFAQYLPETLSRWWQNTKGYVLCWKDYLLCIWVYLPLRDCFFLITVDVLDEEKFNVELIVQCIRVSEMPQTHHHALLLLGTVAGIFPVSINDLRLQPIFCYFLSSVEMHKCSLV